MAEAYAVENLTYEDNLFRDIASYFYRPSAFVRYIFRWGVDELEGQTGPDKWQSQQMDEIGHAFKTSNESGLTALKVAIASGHGIGKGAFTAWIILWFMSTRPNCKGVVTANTFPQLSGKTWAELSLWHNRARNKHWFTWTATRFSAVSSPSTWFIDAITNSENNSEAFAGLHAKDVLVIFDEASAISQKIYEVTEGAMTTPGALWIALGNPTRNSGPFKECFGRFRHRWRTKHIDSREAKMTNKAQIQEWIDDYGIDSDFVKVRVRGMFPSAGDLQFIPTDLAEGAMANMDEHDVLTPLVMGVDVARFGDDQSVIYFRRGRDARTIKPMKYRGLDTMQVADRVSEQIQMRRPQTVFIDETGVGGGVVDRLKQLGFGRIIRGVQFGGKANDEDKYYNKRCEMWGLMKEWLQTGKLAHSNTMLADLTGVEYGFDLHGKIQLEKKSDMKKRGLASPDEADALCMTFAFPVYNSGQVSQFKNKSRLK